MIDGANGKLSAQAQYEADQSSPCRPEPRRLHHLRIGSVLSQHIAISANFTFLTAQTIEYRHLRHRNIAAFYQQAPRKYLLSSMPNVMKAWSRLMDFVFTRHTSCTFDQMISPRQMSLDAGGYSIRHGTQTIGNGLLRSIGKHDGDGSSPNQPQSRALIRNKALAVGF